MGTIRTLLITVEEVKERIHTFPTVVALLQRAARRFKVSTFAIWKRAIVLYWRCGLGPDEAVESGFIDPSVSPELDACAIGHWRLTRFQRQLNHPNWECLVDDKAVFYSYCKGVALPIPRLYAVLDKNSGWAESGNIITNRTEWEHFFENNLPQEFIIKPALGERGHGVTLYRRAGRLFQDSLGQTFSAASLHDRLRNNSQYTRFLLQERVFNHPEIQRLTGTKSLQTLRITTWVTNEGLVELYEAYLKLSLRDNVTDNYDGGRAGNMWGSDVDVETGILGAPLAPSPDGIGLKALPVHPATGIDISGKLLPHWPQTRQLVDRAARLLMPLRTIGWDVAVTVDGPMLIEGNTWWGTSNHTCSSESRRRELARFVTRFTNEP